MPAPPGVSGFGFSMGAVGDVDGDGVPDLAATAFDCLLKVYSGASWAELYAVPICTAPSYGQRYDPQGLGDVDGDGHGDLLIGDPVAFGLIGRVLVLSGADGSILHAVSDNSELYGWSVLALGDGDGARDFASSQPGLSNPAFGIASVDVWSGRTGQLLWHTHAQTYDEELEALGSGGDVDGLDDLALRRRWTNPASGSPITQRFEVWSVAHGPLFVLELPRVSGFAPVGDVDGDGAPDFALSDFDQFPVVGMHGVSVVRIVSFARGVIASSERMPVRVSTLEPIADLNCDGIVELISGDRWANEERGELYLLSGVTGALLNRYDFGPGTRGLGDQVGAFGDLDGDGTTELLDRVYLASGDMRVVVLRTSTMRPLARYCVTTPNSVGSVARLRSLGLLSVFDQRLALGVDGVPPGAAALFVRGVEPAALPFGDGVLCLSPFAGGLARVDVAVADGAGSAWTERMFEAPGASNAAILAGSSWSFQCLYRDAQGGPAGFNTSDALRGTFLP
ncbi:MAG: integrin alpha [Planctomycetota bacterium]